MTNATNTSTSPFPNADQRGVHGHCEPKLRRVLRANAANCVVSGVALAVAAGPIDDVLDTGYPAWIRVVGVALLPFAVVCWWAAAGSLERMRRATPFIVAGDVTWVAASVVTVLLGWYSGGGLVAVLAMAAVIDVFAVLQFVAWRRLSTH